MDYFDVLPEELILIIIGYVDVSNKNEYIPCSNLINFKGTKLMKCLNGFISLSTRNRDIYGKYIEFVEKGIINNFKQFYWKEEEDRSMKDKILQINEKLKAYDGLNMILCLKRNII